MRYPHLSLIACGVVITLCGNWFSFSFHAYQAELYPTAIRAQAVGFVYSWSRFSAIFTSLVIGFLLSEVGVTGVFVFIAGAMVVATTTCCSNAISAASGSMRSPIFASPPMALPGSG